MFLSRYRLHSLRETLSARMIAELFAILRHHRLRLPREMALLFKALLLIEGLALRLDPEFRPASRSSRTRSGSRASGSAPPCSRAGSRGFGRSQRAGAGPAGSAAPTRRRRRRQRSPGAPPGAELEPLVGRAERIGNRLVAGMISAALISSIGGLVSNERKWRSWEGKMLGTGLGAISAPGAYLGMDGATPGRPTLT